MSVYWPAVPKYVQQSRRMSLLNLYQAVADIYHLTAVNWAPFHKIDLSKWSKLKDFMARVAARPKAEDALRAEGLMK